MFQTFYCATFFNFWLILRKSKLSAPRMVLAIVGNASYHHVIMT